MSPGDTGEGRGRLEAPPAPRPPGEGREPAAATSSPLRPPWSDGPPRPRAPEETGAPPEAPTPATRAVGGRGRLGTVTIALLAGVGSLLVADAVATVVWQEPFTAVLGHQRQSRLQDELAALDAAPPGLVRSGPDLVGLTSQLGTLPSARKRPRPQSAPNAAQQVRRLAAAERAELKPGRAVGRLRIPRLGDSWAMIEGIGEDQLKSGPGHYPTSSLPGLPGTTAIAGHRTTYGAPFRHIERLRTGDRITVQMPYGTVDYRVEGHRIVDPSDTSSLRDIGRPRLVLTACTPLYSAAQRWVVFARQMSVRPRTM